MENIIGFAVVAVLLWLAFRWLVCWYYKINKIVRLLEYIDRKLQHIAKAQGMTVDALERRTDEPKHEYPKYNA